VGTTSTQSGLRHLLLIPSPADTSNLGVLITCLGHGGKVLPLNEEADYERWLCMYSVGVAWISSKRSSPCKDIPIFSSMEAENRVSLSQCDAE
jgi:hypothetical protein